MTELMEQAFNKASALPDEMQNLIAKDLLNEIAWETQWDNVFQESQTQLEEMAREALQEHSRGETELQDIDRL